jgi:NAD(P)-dependent dehydrogenase (short-subunit alcohol dehydrogenase family)
MNDAMPVALITGSTKGLGRILAKKYSQEGYEVITNSRMQDVPPQESDKTNDNITYIPGDVASHQAARVLIDRVRMKRDRLDTLICNVGSGSSVPPGHETYNEWLRVLNANFFSATNVIEPSMELLSRSENASIICISSICGTESIEGAPVTYSVAKAALNAYIKVISRAYAQMGVRINGVAPGNILMKGNTWEARLLDDPKSTLEYIKKEVPLNRFCDPEGIAELAIFLSSSAGRCCTGSIYTIDAGQTRSF